ncbi:hypothetical protein [Lutibacter sp.]|uniref:hypothetical protein n=1 Tax=Lutibacter sp. TaxID=1925666 RepID=UPI003561E68C
MKNYILLFSFLAFFLAPRSTNAQEEEKVTVKISGHIWTESIFDTRQTVSARDGDVLLFPANEKIDANGKDINAKANFNMLNIHSRARLKITAPSFLNAKVTGLIEGDFVGSANDKIGLLRLRHAMVKLNWAKSELLAGQYWHPIFSLDVYPQVASWGAALPYFPLERSAQLRYSYGATENSKFSIAASTQLDFKSNGPNGPSTEYIRNAAMPEFNATYVLGLKSNFLIGANVGYKTLKPQLSYTVGASTYKSEESIGSYHLNLFSKIKMDKAAIRLGVIYGQDLYEFVMLGGYGVSGTNSKGEATYTNFTTGSYWFDVDSGLIGEKITLGLFGGYTKNYGSDDPITGAVYARGTDIDCSYRVSPRIVYGAGKVRFRCEVSYDTAAYGTPDANYKVKNTNNVSNARFLFATTLHF